MSEAKIEWKEKLIGKTILDDDQETVLSEGEFIRKKDLPKPNRVVGRNSMMTMDFVECRLNVHVDDQMKVTGVNFVFQAYKYALYYRYVGKTIIDDDEEVVFDNYVRKKDLPKNHQMFTIQDENSNSNSTLSIFVDKKKRIVHVTSTEF